MMVAAVTLAAFAALVASALAPTTSHASPLDLFGQGARSAGRGGVGAVTGIDGESLGANPSGVAAHPQMSLTIGTLFGSIDLDANGEARPASSPRGTSLVAVMPVRLGGAANKRLVLGVEAFIPKDNLVRLSYPGARTPNFTLLEQRTQMTGLGASLAMSLSPSLRIGAGASAVLALAGSITLQSDGFGGLYTLAEQNVLIDAAPIVGVQWDPRPNLRLGAVYRGELAAKYEILFTPDTDASFPLPLPDLTLRGVGQYEPRHAAFAAQWDVAPTWRVLAEVTYFGWGAFPRPAEPLTPQTSDPIPAPNFKDIIAPRIGLDATFALADGPRLRDNRLVVRGGYTYMPTPTPDAPAYQAILDNDRHIMGMGLGFSTAAGANTLWVDVWAQAQEFVAREHPRLGAGYTSDGRILAGGLSVGATL